MSTCGWVGTRTCLTSTSVPEPTLGPRSPAFQVSILLLMCVSLQGMLLSMKPGLQASLFRALNSWPMWWSWCLWVGVRRSSCSSRMLVGAPGGLGAGWAPCHLLSSSGPKKGRLHLDNPLEKVPWLHSFQLLSPGFLLIQRSHKEPGIRDTREAFFNIHM